VFVYMCVRVWVGVRGEGLQLLVTDCMLPQVLIFHTANRVRQATMQLLSPAYMLPDRVFQVLDKCPQLATRTCVQSKLEALESQLGCSKRRLGAAVVYFPTLLTMSEERLTALPRTVVRLLTAWPVGRFSALMAAKAAELESSAATQGSEWLPGGGALVMEQDQGAVEQADEAGGEEQDVLVADHPEQQQQQQPPVEEPSGGGSEMAGAPGMKADDVQQAPTVAADAAAATERASSSAVHREPAAEAAEAEAQAAEAAEAEAAATAEAAAPLSDPAAAREAVAAPEASPAAAAPQSSEVANGPLTPVRAAALASAFLLAQPQMLIKSPTSVSERWGLLNTWLQGHDE